MKISSCLLLIMMFPAPLLFAEVLPGDDAPHQELQYLKNLKVQDPQAYQKIIEDKKTQIRGYVQEIKSQGGAQYQEFIQQEKQSRKKSLEYFREHHPEGFQEFVGRRLDRVETLSKKNPEKFKSLMKEHPVFQERYNKLQEQRRNNQDQGFSAGAKERSLKAPVASENQGPGARSLRGNDNSRLRRSARNKVIGRSPKALATPPEADPSFGGEAISGHSNLSNSKREMKKEGARPAFKQNSFAEKPEFSSDHPLGMQGQPQRPFRDLKANEQSNRPNFNRPDFGPNVPGSGSGGGSESRPQAGGNSPQRGTRERERR